MQISEGRARYNGSVFIYEYILPIILAMLERLLQRIQGIAKVIQENSYFPLGLNMSGSEITFVSGDKNYYVYNGKSSRQSQVNTIIRSLFFC